MTSTMKVEPRLLDKHGVAALKALVKMTGTADRPALTTVNFDILDDGTPILWASDMYRLGIIRCANIGIGVTRKVGACSFNGKALTRAVTRDATVIITSNGLAVTWPDMTLLTLPASDSSSPVKWEKLLPDTPDMLPAKPALIGRTGLDPSLLADFSALVSHDPKFPSAVALHFQGDNKAIVVTSLSGTLVGLLMPCRMLL